jgi:hypothetical protein
MSKHLPQTCWICGDRADTREHRIKKADLVRSYGRGPYKGPSAPVHVRNGVVTPIQGPRAAVVKYSPSLCGPCNSTKTQDYDRAYDGFLSWVLANQEEVLYRRFVDFSEVYGADFEEAQRNLFKYFVKSLGCRIVDAGYSVPDDLVALLPEMFFRTALKLTFCVNETVLLLPEKTRSVFIGKGNLIAWPSKDNPATHIAYTWNEHVSWLTTCYWYNQYPEGHTGSTWIADNRYIYLGSAQSLSVEEKEKLLDIIRDDPEN